MSCYGVCRRRRPRCPDGAASCTARARPPCARHRWCRPAGRTTSFPARASGRSRPGDVRQSRETLVCAVSRTSSEASSASVQCARPAGGCPQRAQAHRAGARTTAQHHPAGPARSIAAASIDQNPCDGVLVANVDSRRLMIFPVGRWTDVTPGRCPHSSVMCVAH